MSKPRFDVRRRADGKFTRWELKFLSEVGAKLGTVKGIDGRDHPIFDHRVWVVTGVFNTRKEAFGSCPELPWVTA